MTDRNTRMVRAWVDFNEAYARLAGEIEANLTRGTGLPMRWFEMLSLLYDTSARGLNQTDISERLGLSQSATSRMIDKLIELDLVTRERSAQDARESHVKLTGPGRERLVEARALHVSEVVKRFGEPVNRLGLDLFPALLGQLVAEHDDGADEPADDQADGPETLMSFGESVLSVRSDATVLADTQHVREYLEPLVLLEAARFHTPADLADMRALLDTMADSVGDPTAYYQADWALHARLAQVCRNRVLRSMYLALLDVLTTEVSAVVERASDLAYVKERLTVHAGLLDAVASRDAARVREAAEAHRFMRHASEDGGHEGTGR